MTSRRSIPRRPGGALRKFGWLAAATLLALSVFAPTASAAPPSDECMAADSSFEYSVDGGPFNTVVVNGPPSEFPQNTVTVRVKDGVDLPQGCVREFSLGSFTAGGATWPESVYEHFLDIDTAALSNENRSATLEVEVPAPGCFGQTDFYTDAYTNGIFFPGSTRYEGPLEPRYPDVPTPYGKISGANGGEVECLDHAIAVSLGSDPVSLGSDPVSLGSDPVSLGSDPVSLGSDALSPDADAERLRRAGRVRSPDSEPEWRRRGSDGHAERDPAQHRSARQRLDADGRQLADRSCRPGVHHRPGPGLHRAGAGPPEEVTAVLESDLDRGAVTVPRSRFASAALVGMSAAAVSSRLAGPVAQWQSN